ncbi:dihydroneopterin triphosphate diphosphatase [Polynucleobacter sp. CS-Odin-A6]|uniref:dihydroneopterin triphosphate diphosphatase n=1 Tax=Polynucleobacter sp. CS-Odin-A6 TaxID=2689106 RepID=UPI001C0CCC2C|nr:dihydroneopterin triphosphate diphosphatase [Polynucleobacter sp. CS-Odin-A6]MBU3620163.1 dihydroneopterin triphosphate diphosphatase [Polynucleobacter sp. CS-Odin-A6]
MKIPISVLVVIYKSNGEVLLIERADKTGFWQSVTGSVDAIDEDLSVAAAREVLEETGIDTQSLPASSLKNMHHQIQYEIYPQWRHRYAPGVTSNTEHWFSLLVPDNTSVTLAPREHVAYEWLPFTEASRRCFSPSNGDAILQLFSTH